MVLPSVEVRGAVRWRLRLCLGPRVGVATTRGRWGKTSTTPSWRCWS